jgi:hypothetical protein
MMLTQLFTRGVAMLITLLCTKKIEIKFNFCWPQQWPVTV